MFCACFHWTLLLSVLLPMEFTGVEGVNGVHSVGPYALSTCGWCSGVKMFLGERGMAYEYVDM